MYMCNLHVHVHVGTSLSSPTQIISKPKTRKRGRPPKVRDEYYN